MLKRKLSGDGSPSTIFAAFGWQSFPANRNATSPRVWTPHLLRDLLPDAKFLVQLRNPVNRCTSVTLSSVHLHIFKITLFRFQNVFRLPSLSEARSERRRLSSAMCSSSEVRETVSRTVFLERLRLQPWEKDALWEITGGTVSSLVSAPITDSRHFFSNREFFVI